jgi:hypothetical protein
MMIDEEQSGGCASLAPAGAAEAAGTRSSGLLPVGYREAGAGAVENPVENSALTHEIGLSDIVAG